MGDITTSMQRSTAGVCGAAPGAPPLPMSGELARPHLVARLAARWSVPVTVVVAGAGFGKSTLLAQTSRADAISPPGVERWVACEARHEHATELADAVIAALGRRRHLEDPVDAVIDGLRRLAPLDVCVVLDDVHHLGPSSSGAALLAELAPRLPANAHLVLSSRVAPPIPLARLRAADRLLELTESELAFGPGEVERLAARAGRSHVVALPFAGWPALVRVALAARPGIALGYAREEVLADLDAADRRTLLALATVGTADDAFIGRVVERPVHLGDLADRVPMVTRVDDTRCSAHELWLDALARVVDATVSRAVQDRAVEELLAAGDVVRAGDVAIVAANWPALARAAMDLVRTTVSVLPVEVAARWSAALGAAGAAGAPEARLLDGAVRVATDVTDRSVDAVLDGVADEFRARGDAAAEVSALAVATVAAHSRGDTERLVGLALRTAGVRTAGDLPIVRLAACSVAAVVAEMRGNPEQAIEELAAIPVDGVPPALTVSTHRFLMHCLLLAGRAADATAVADEFLALATSAHTRTMPAFCRWLDGDPGPYLGLVTEPADDVVTSVRDAAVATAFGAVIRASRGDRVPVDGGRFTAACARDAAVLANARAAQAIVEHDEIGAAAAFSALRDGHPSNPVVERHLRRFLALGYVLDPGLRAEWSRAALGPSHERARAVARLFVDLRARGRVDAAGLDPAHVFTVLPLPWSVELACRLQASDARRGEALLEWLLEHVGCAAHAELRDAAAASDRELAAGAAALLSRLPRQPGEVVTIDVLGPLHMQRSGAVVTGGDARRQRVRELLAMLVVDGTVSRDRAIEALWPELDLDAGGRNLRVTLTYLRRLLEPDRPVGEASYHVRTDATSIRLAPSAHLRVDLWELRRLTTEAARARAAGDVATAIELLAAATLLWRGTPLVDLDRVAGYDAETARIRLLQTTSLLELGELRLTVGDAAGAADAAERALQIEPFLEAAHRLAIAAATQRGDRARVHLALGRARRALAELGVTPDATTSMLMRAAGRDHRVTELAS